jgi:hypothetical protein
VVAGCGGDGGKLDRRAYAAKLSALCADFSAREKKIGEPHTFAEVAERGPQIIKAFDDAIRDKVKELQAADEIAAQARRFRELADEQHDALTALVRAAKANDQVGGLDIEARNAAVNREAGELARALGARACIGPV